MEGKRGNESVSYHELLEKVPRKTGVYLFRDAKGKILYIGKAKQLKSRVRSYFSPDETRPFSHLLRPKINKIDWIVTGNEKEALILEDSLIKQYQPRYNIDLKDDKSFVNIILTAKDAYPRLYVGRSRTGKEEGSICFGPYPSAEKAREVVRLIQKVFPVRTCSMTKFRAQSRPCLNHQLGICLAPCCEPVPEEEYSGMIKRIRLLLSGKGQDLLDQLHSDMKEASRAMRYERAALIRDRIQALESVLIRQRLVSPRPEDRDIFGYHREGDRVAMVIFSVRAGRLLQSSPYIFNGVRLDDREVLGSFLTQYYQAPREIPAEIILPFEPDDFSLVQELISDRAGGKGHIRTLKKAARKSLFRLAQENARVYLLSHFPQAGNVLEGLQKMLRLPALPRRVEAFDVSHLGGTNAVGASVCFRDGEPDKNEYRRYRIQMSPGHDDLVMLHEIVCRRYKRVSGEGGPLPDLVLIDGGKGQLGAALQAFSDLGIPPPPVVALSKGRGKKPSGPGRMAQEEGIYLPGRKNPLRPKSRTTEMRFLDRIRDEVHRFAITFQKKKRKEIFRSELDDIPGIGPTRRKALLMHFGGMEKLRDASVDEIAGVSGIGKKQAETLFHAIQKGRVT